MFERIRAAYHALVSSPEEISAQPDRPEWQGWNTHLGQIRAAYEAALPREDLWTLADFKDADATLLPHIRQRIRTRTRYEAANNPVVKRIVRIWANDVVAETGPWPKLNTGNKRVDKFIETAWLRWWDKSNQAGKLRTAVKSEATDGESVGVIFNNSQILEDQHPLSAVSTDVKGLETDRLADPNFNGGNLKNYIDGVHLDPFSRQPIAYDILRAHPGTEYLDAIQDIFEHDTFDRRQILHAYDQDRPEQHRGVSRYVCSIAIAGFHRQYLEADLNRQKLRAAFAFAITSEAAGDTGDEGEPGSNEAGWFQSINLPNRQGIGCMFPDGMKPIQFEANGESAELDQFHRIVGGLVAGCFSMPLGRALGVYGSSGYAPMRGELLPYHHEIASDRQQIWQPRYLTPLYKAFLLDLRFTDGWRMLMQEIGAETPDFLGAYSLDLTNVTWNWPEKELVVDPSREEEATRKKLASGRICREDTIDAADLDEHDRRCARSLGYDDDEAGVKAFRQATAAAIFNVQLPSQEPDEETGDEQTAAQKKSAGSGSDDIGSS